MFRPREHDQNDVSAKKGVADFSFLVELARVAGQIQEFEGVGQAPPDVIKPPQTARPFEQDGVGARPPRK